MIKPTLLLLGLSLGMAAFAQSFTRIDEFTGTYQDDFESYPTNEVVQSTPLIGGHAQAEVQFYDGPLPPRMAFWHGISTATSGLQTLNMGWPGFGGQIKVEFDEPMSRFGAYWWVRDPRGDALNITLYFYGPKAGGGETYLGFDEIEQNSPDPLEPLWRGWESPAGFTSVYFTSSMNSVYADDMRITPVPEPGSMAVVGAGLLVALRKRRSS